MKNSKDVSKIHLIDGAGDFIYTPINFVLLDQYKYKY